MNCWTNSGCGLRRTEVNKVLGRSGILGQHYDTYAVTVFEHSRNSDPCSCNRRDAWYSVFDMMNLRSSWHEIAELGTY